MKIAELLFENIRERRDNAQLKRDYQQWKRLVNVPTPILRAMLTTEYDAKTGLSVKDLRIAKSYRMTNSTVRAILRMRKTPFADWKTGDINWMTRQLNYIKQQKLRNKDVPLLKDGNPTNALKNLWAWGHIPKGLRPKE